MYYAGVAAGNGTEEQRALLKITDEMKKEIRYAIARANGVVFQVEICSIGDTWSFGYSR
jgi:hypothetical protein